MPIDKRTFLRNRSKTQRAYEEITTKELIIPVTKDGLCVFLKPDLKCAIYPYRPSICRKYGESDALPCPYYHPDGSKRTKEETEKLLKEISKSVDEFTAKPSHIY